MGKIEKIQKRFEKQFGYNLTSEEAKQYMKDVKNCSTHQQVNLVTTSLLEKKAKQEIEE